MKEFVEKLIERLEEEKSDWNYDYNVPINKSIQIVNDLASEYNNGWISVEDELPEDVVLATTKDGILYIATYDTIYKEWFDDNFERKIDVIAWQPLPAPYRKGE